MPRYTAVSCWILLGVATPAVCAQGVLQQMREDADKGVKREEDEQEEDQSKKHRHHHRHHPHECSAWERLWGQVLWYGISSPFWGPPVWIGDDYDSTTYLSCYPYQHEYRGFVLLDPLPPSNEMFNWSLRARGEYVDDFDSLTRYSGRILWESRNRFGIDTSVDYRRESLPHDRHDDLWTGDANVVFRFAQSEYLMVRSGLGVNYLSADHGTDLGLNFTYAGDWFPVKPWVVSAELDWGWVGRAGLFRVRTTLGVNIQNVEVYTGFSYDDIGSAQIKGLVSGLQVWY